MALVSVPLENYPEHANAIQRHALKLIHHGTVAQIDKAVWRAIQRSEYPSASDPLGPPASDAAADPGSEKPGERGCCDPPPDA